MNRRWRDPAWFTGTRFGAGKTMGKPWKATNSYVCESDQGKNPKNMKEPIPHPHKAKSMKRYGKSMIRFTFIYLQFVSTPMQFFSVVQRRTHPTVDQCRGSLGSLPLEHPDVDFGLELGPGTPGTPGSFEHFEAA